jgi:hypothetical protein
MEASGGQAVVHDRSQEADMEYIPYDQVHQKISFSFYAPDFPLQHIVDNDIDNALILVIFPIWNLRRLLSPQMSQLFLFIHSRHSLPNMMNYLLRCFTFAFPPESSIIRIIQLFVRLLTFKKLDFDLRPM